MPFIRQNISSLMLLCLLGVGLTMLGADKRAGAHQPNILFLLIDDQRNDTLGCAGHPVIQTPVIDSLAAEGVRFSNAFVTTSICAASRASVLTGLYERTHGYTFGKPPISAAHMAQSYPAVLREAGYRTGFIGKYGVKTEGKPEQEIFDVYQPSPYDYFLEQPDGSKRHATEIKGDQAIQFLKDNPGDKPFCLSISFNAPHAVDGDKEDHYPWPPAMDGLYDDVQIAAPRLGDASIFENHPDFMKESLNRIRYKWRWDTPEKYQKNMKAYFRMLSGIDRVIGRIRNELNKLDLAENTVIIYMGDNGYYMGDRGFAGKWSHYEQSLRVPLIVYDPRLPNEHRSVVNDEMALNIDVPATMLALAGAKIPSQYQGRDLSLLLEGEEVLDWRDDFFCEHLMAHEDIPKWEGVRGERYVYARYFEQQPVYEYLHDLKSDPDQLVNLATQDQQKAVLVRMRARCDELKAKYEPSREPPPIKIERFEVEDQPAFLILPETISSKEPTPWVLYAPTLGKNLPGDAEHWMFRQFLDAGIAISGVDVGESYGSPKGRVTYNALHRQLTQQRNFAPQASLLARSRGGLMLYCWAADNPEKVSCIAGIYPVCNIASYPGIQKACGAYDMTEAELTANLNHHNPIDRLAPLANAKVPIFHIHGDKDGTVPLDKNSAVVKEQYDRLGGDMILEVVEGQGHNMWSGWFESQRLVDFVIGHANNAKAN